MLVLVTPALAASLDNLEIGGPWGTPTATDATAAWWNPAGLAAGEGTRLMIEGAPTFATVTFSRDDPHGGNDIYQLAGVVPFAGVASDLTVPGLGLGLALAVPFVRGGSEVEEPGPGAYHMRSGDSKAVYLLAGAGYEFFDRVAVGASVAYVQSSWTARVDQDSMVDLASSLRAEGETPTYTDADLEDRDYAASLQFSDLKDTAITFGGGLRVKITDQVEAAIAYSHGARVDNTGTVDMYFQCPPDSDTLGYAATQIAGVCTTGDNVFHADATVGYTLPSRIHGGVAVMPIPQLRLEAMGGWVGWSAYTDFDITTSNSDVEAEKGKALVERTRKWARDNVDSGWVGLDAKGYLGERWTLGARVTYDAAAVPDEALSTNNYDANDVMTSVLVAVKPLKHVELGVSWTHHFLAERVVTDSAFYQTVEGEAPEDRWNYPQMNGTYGGQIDRVGIAVRAGF